MKNTLLIHMGMPKTGTTALQWFLYENRKKLQEYGWCYPDLKEELPDITGGCIEKNGFIFCAPMGEWWEQPKLQDDRNIIWSQILMHLESKNVIISSEELFMSAKTFLQEAKEQYGNIKVVIYLRRQDKMVESAWNQLIKNGCKKTFQEFIRQNKDVLGWTIPYSEKLDEISKIIGKENLIVRVYEKQQFNGSNHTLESDFLSILGIEPDWDEWKPCAHHNPGLHGNYIELKRIFNSIQDARGAGIAWDSTFTPVYMQMSERFSEHMEQGYFSEEERKAFLEQCASDNERIAREYLHREDGILFYDTKMDYPVYDANCYSSFEADMFCVLSAMVCNLDKRMQAEMQRLTRWNSALTEKLILGNQRERELLFFGAGQKCREVLETIKFTPVNIVDNDKTKRGRKIKGIEILHAADIGDWSEYYVVVTCVQTDEIEMQLQNYGLKKGEDYVLAKEYFAYD